MVSPARQPAARGLPVFKRTLVSARIWRGTSGDPEGILPGVQGLGLDCRKAIGAFGGDVTVPSVEVAFLQSAADGARGWFRYTIQAAGESVEDAKAVMRIRPYRARDFRQWQGCHIRV